jgi:hypothetical protein
MYAVSKLIVVHLVVHPVYLQAQALAWEAQALEAQALEVQALEVQALEQEAQVLEVQASDPDPDHSWVLDLTKGYVNYKGFLALVFKSLFTI